MSNKENKDKRISVNKLENTRKSDTVQVPFSVEDETVTITIYKVLPLPKMLEFVETVVSSVVDVDDGSYLPEIKDMMVRKMVLTLYANFTMPQKAKKQYDLLYNTSAYDLVIDNIDLNVFEELVHSVDCKIRHRLNLMNNMAHMQMKDLVGKVDAAIETFESAFSKVDVDELSSFVRNISRVDSIDETKVVDAVLHSGNKSKETQQHIALLDGVKVEGEE